jgi:hypothetical protein
LVAVFRGDVRSDLKIGLWSDRDTTVTTHRGAHVAKSKAHKKTSLPVDAGDMCGP